MATCGASDNPNNLRMYTLVQVQRGGDPNYCEVDCATHGKVRCKGDNCAVTHDGKKVPDRAGGKRRFFGMGNRASGLTEQKIAGLLPKRRASLGEVSANLKALLEAAGEVDAGHLTDEEADLLHELHRWHGELKKELKDR